MYEWGVVSVFNKPAHSFFVWGSFVSICCPALLLSLLSGFHVLTPITCIQPLSRCSLTLLASSFFSKSVVIVFSFSFPHLFHHAFFLFYLWLWLIDHFVPACQLTWLGQPFCISLVVCICLHPDALSLVVLISVLLYQSAAFVFLDGSWVSEGLVSYG